MKLEKTYIDFFGDEWYEQLKDVLCSDYFNNLRKFLYEEKKAKTIYPINIKVAFRAFRETPFTKIKVIIIGQDIYHTPNSFDGLAFSNANVKNISPSLRAILNEVKRDCYHNQNYKIDKDLTRWAKQGVFLINVGLTVVKGQPGSHLNKWLPFMFNVIKKLNENKEGIIYLLWGNFAQKYEQFIDKEKNHILKAGHPSPLNTKNPFAGCSHFSEVNKLLKNKIVW